MPMYRAQCTRLYDVPSCQLAQFNFLLFIFIIGGFCRKMFSYTNNAKLEKKMIFIVQMIDLQHFK